jgi:YfiH family protein
VTLPAPFRAAGEHIAVDLPGATALFTTRRGGVSRGPYASLNLGVLTEDERPHVRSNQRLLAEAVGIPFERFARGMQVHATTVRALTEPPEAGAPLEPADGQATSAPGVAATVLVADCLPVAVAGDGAVAMLHCGWRGLADGIVSEGVRAVRELGAEGPLSAAIGPGIGPCCFEVGDEVRERFSQHGAGVQRDRNLDLKEIARRELRAAGVDEVADVGLCTHCGGAELFFSHRRDAGVTGRQAGVAWLT